MKITFDPDKHLFTLETRGLDMADAEQVFVGKNVTMLDDRKDYGEERFVTVGFVNGRMVYVAWTPRDGAYRIISMRKANEREQQKYGPQMD
jgi:uncharacterized protein